MKYHVLRNCYTRECQYFRKGDTVELPDGMYKSPKNFKPLRESPPETEPEAKVFTCAECDKECKSAFGLQSHMRSHK